MFLASAVFGKTDKTLKNPQKYWTFFILFIPQKMNAKNKDIRQKCSFLAKSTRFWRKVLVFGDSKMEELVVRKQDYKGTRCEKVRMSKCVSIVKTYDSLGSLYAKQLQADDSVQSFETCIPLIGVGEDKYMADFLIKMQDGTMRVRECSWLRRNGALLRKKRA